MEFCIICPVAGLERYATLSKTHLVLAQIEDPKYQEFYIKRRQAGDTLILDNGCYEQGSSIQESHFVDAIELYNPQWVVCPDALFRPWEVTFSMTASFLDKYYDRFHSQGIKFLGIPQTTKGDIMGWIDGCFSMLNELPLDGIGLPRALVTDYYPHPLTRVNACKLLKRRYANFINGLYIHAMGMANGDVTELSALRDAGCDSIDSSAPVWRGWNELTLTDPDDQKVWDLKGTECDFNAPIKFTGAGKRDYMILNNLEACGIYVNRNQPEL